jgi:hypothetical protein
LRKETDEALQNSDCEYLDRCSIRSEDQSGGDTGADPPDSTEPPQPARPTPFAPGRFGVIPTGRGWVGRLFIDGRLETTIRPAMDDALDQWDTLAGLMILINTAGGSGTAKTSCLTCWH